MIAQTVCHCYITVPSRGLYSAVDVLVKCESSVTLSAEAMLCRTLTPSAVILLLLMMMSYSTSSSSDSDPTVRLASSRPARRTYLARGLTGRVHCPAEDDPPHRLVIWSKGGHVLQSLDHSSSSRISVDFGGILVVEDVQPSDAGDYRCALYSPHDDQQTLSFIITVVVKGQFYSMCNNNTA